MIYTTGGVIYLYKITTLKLLMRFIASQRIAIRTAMPKAPIKFVDLVSSGVVTINTVSLVTIANGMLTLIAGVFQRVTKLVSFPF